MNLLPRLFLGMLLSGHLVAQPALSGWPALTPAYVTTFGIDHGLSQPCASDVVTDRQGRLWVGTCSIVAGVNSARLFQFDGYDFFPVNLANDTLPNRTVAVLRQLTPSGALLGYLESRQVNALFEFDPDRHTTRVLPFDLESEGLIGDLTVRPDGTLLVALLTTDSVRIYTLDGQWRKSMLAAWPLPARLVLSEFSAPARLALHVVGDDLFVAGDVLGGIYRLAPARAGGRVVREAALGRLPAPLAGPEALVTDQFAQRIVPTVRGDLVVFLPGCTGQVFVRRRAAAGFELLDGLPDGYSVCRVEPDAAGNLLVLLRNAAGTYAALLYDAHGARYDYSAFVASHAAIYNVRSVNFLQSVFICASDGLSYKSIRADQAVRCLLPGHSVRAMVEVEPGRFFISNQGTTSAWYDAHTGEARVLTPHEPLNRAFGVSFCRQLTRAADGSIWGTNGDTVVQYFPGTKTWRHVLAIPQLLYAVVLADGRVAVYSVTGGLAVIDPVTGRADPHVPPLPGFPLHEMHQTRDGLLWLLTANGLWRIDLAARTRQRLGFEPPFRDFRFTCMAEGDQGQLWLGTFFGGIHLYDPATGHVRVIDKSHGLPDATIASITRDAAGTFWAATYRGLSRLAPDGRVLANFSRNEGLCELEFNRYAALRAADGQLLLGTIDGLHVVAPRVLDQARPAGHSPKIYLCALTAPDETGQERTRQAGFDRLPAVELPPDRPYLHVRFALSGYDQPERNQFAYRIEGRDDEWTPIGTQHELTFYNLPPGQYTLLIRGCDLRGNWSAEPLRIQIHARDFFYHEPWFYLLCLLPFAGIGWAWVQRLRGEKSRLEKEVIRRTEQIRQDKQLIEQQARELRQLDAVKSRFFTNISHELRTPITLITTPVEQLLAQPGAAADPATHQSLQWVLHNGRKLAALVEELLDLSRLEAGKIELQESPTALLPFSRQLFGAFESQARSRQIDYRFEFAAAPDRTAVVDQRRLEKILNNLLSNALKFTPAGGRVALSVTEQSAGGDRTRLVFRIEDTGRGIPSDDLPHVFERYFQTRHDDLARQGGIGIGLALARELAQLMHGELTAESTWGEGSCFTLTVPLRIAPAAGETPVPAPVEPPGGALVPVAATAAAPASAPHLLIVEDNPDMQALLQSLLAPFYRLSIAHDGVDALEFLTNGHRAPDLILSDVMMPRLDGYGLLEKLKSDTRWQGVPVVMLTARSAEPDKLEALQLGVDDYLIKPFSPRELSARLANLLANYRRRQNLQARALPDLEFEPIDSRDSLWLKRIETSAKNALEQGLPLSVALLAEAGSVSERQLFREIKRLTGLTPNQYVLEVRLQKARYLLENRAYATLAEVAYAVGFDTPAYFTRVFEKHFGKHPSAFFNA